MARLSFDEIWAAAVARKGELALLERLPRVASAEELEALGDDRWLAAMAKVVFAAGFRWRVIQAKWPGFEAAFEGFAPEIVRAYGADHAAALARDTRIVRNPQKIAATIANAAFVAQTSAEHGGFGRWVARWPDDDVVGLWAALEKGGTRLGGATGPRALRSMGKDTFILTPDVTYALLEQGVLSGSGAGKRARQAAQEAFSAWKRESGRPMAQISVVLACTVDRPSDDDDE